jgi:hypothetical protein
MVAATAASLWEPAPAATQQGCLVPDTPSRKTSTQSGCGRRLGQRDRLGSNARRAEEQGVVRSNVGSRDISLSCATGKRGTTGRSSLLDATPPQERQSVSGDHVAVLPATDTEAGRTALAPLFRAATNATHRGIHQPSSVASDSPDSSEASATMAGDVCFICDSFQCW